MNLRGSWVAAIPVIVCVGCSSPDKNQFTAPPSTSAKPKVDLGRKPRREPPTVQPSNVPDDPDAPKVAAIGLEGTKWRGSVPIGPGYKPENPDRPQPPELDLTIVSESEWKMYFPYGGGQRSTGTLERDGRVVIFRVLTVDGKPATGDNAVTQRYLLSKDGKEMVNEASSKLVFRRVSPR